MENSRHSRHEAGDSSPDTSTLGNGVEKSVNHSPDAQHLETSDVIESQGAARGFNDPSYVDHRENDDRADQAKGRNADKFEKKYWLSVNYIGALFAIGMAFMGGIGGYGLIAPVLTEINAEIGPSPNINWVPLVNLFFIFGSCLGLIGSIIGATVQDVNTLIGAEVFIGIAVAFQQSFFGLNWGGVLYPWNSPQVIATMVIGAVCLFGVLPAYEIFISKRGKEPYLPLHLFKNIRLQSAAWNTGIGACVYYGFSLVFPQVVTTLYLGRGEISSYDVGTLAGLVPMSFVFAQMCHGFIVWFTGPKWAMIGAAVISAALLTAASVNLDNRALTQGLVIPGAFAMGVVESVSITTSTFPLRSQEEIGQGGGLSGSTRNFTSAIAVAVYTATLSNRLLVTIPQHVYPVALKMGLSHGSLEALATALQGKGAYSAVEGLTPAIQAGVQEPYRIAFKNAASTVFLISLAFSGTAVVLACFTTNNDKSTEYYVAGGLHGQNEEKEYLQEFKHHRRASQTSETKG